MQYKEDADLLAAMMPLLAERMNVAVRDGGGELADAAMMPLLAERMNRHRHAAGLDVVLAAMMPLLAERMNMVLATDMPWSTSPQ